MTRISQLKLACALCVFGFVTYAAYAGVPCECRAPGHIPLPGEFAPLGPGRQCEAACATNREPGGCGPDTANYVCDEAMIPYNAICAHYVPYDSTGDGNPDICRRNTKRPFFNTPAAVEGCTISYD